VVLSPRRRRGGPLQHPDTDADGGVAPIQFRLEASHDGRVTDDGRRLDGRGYTICDPRTGTPLGEDDFFFRIGGGIVADLDGAEGHGAELQNLAFGPGRALTLVRQEPRVPDGPPVVAVFDLSTTLQAGELPPEVADAIAFYGDSYEAAFCLWEWRAETGQRVGLRMLLAPGWTVEPLPDPPTGEGGT
jgi:hypothetical protein